MLVVSSRMKMLNKLLLSNCYSLISLIMDSVQRKSSKRERFLTTAWCPGTRDGKLSFQKCRIETNTPAVPESWWWRKSRSTLAQITACYAPTWPYKPRPNCDDTLLIRKFQSNRSTWNKSRRRFRSRRGRRILVLWYTTYPNRSKRGPWSTDNAPTLVRLDKLWPTSASTWERPRTTAAATLTRRSFRCRSCIANFRCLSDTAMISSKNEIKAIIDCPRRDHPRPRGTGLLRKFDSRNSPIRTFSF